MAENTLPAVRNQTIDAAKGIGIFLVVFAHINYIEPWQSIIYGFHIPLFFILAGMTFQKDKYSSFWVFVKRRIKTLLVPYLFFAIISVLVRVALDIVFNGFSGAVFVSAGKRLVQFVTARYSQRVEANVALWFVPCLFLMECMYYLIIRIPSRVAVIGTIVLLVCVGWYTESDYCPVDFSVLPWNFSSACFSIGFYAVGHLFVSKLTPFTFTNRPLSQKVCALVSAGVCFAVAIVAAHFNGRVTIGTRILGNGFLFYVSGIMGSLGVLFIGELIQNFSLVTFWGRSSFCIMATHLLLQRTILLSYKNFLHGNHKTTYYSWGKSTLIFIVVMTISSVLAVLYTRMRQFIRKKKEQSKLAAM